MNRSTPSGKEPYPGGCKIISEGFKHKQIPECAINTMLKSISPSTIKQYESTYKLWWTFCKINEISLYNPTISYVLQFLQNIFETKNYRYGTMNSHKSALSLILQNNIESDSRVSRFMKAISKINPSAPKYNNTWDPAQVINYYKVMGSNSKLTVKQLSYKLVTLLTLVTGHRLQTISLIRISNIQESSTGLQIFITDAIKTSGINKIQPCLHIPFFRDNPTLCVASTLITYKEKTMSYRKPEQDLLFLTHQRPYRVATKQSLSRWVKESLKEAGIDTNIFKPHSVRHASTSSAHRQGSNTKSTVAILNCLTARQLCFNDSSCSSILEIIPRVCGPEVVACSTVTVTKCQAALRTLQAFPFFKPTCLCREPHVDPECNSFRDFLFDHPCVFVKEKAKDPYPVDALPTCTHAHFVCQQEPKCIKLYEDFKIHCKVRDNKCRMEDREQCYDAWAGLRRSPMFGCICPNNHMKKRCDRMFSMVNHNPCVASDNTSASYPDDIGNVLLKNPLVDVANGQDAHADYDHISVNILKNEKLKGHKLHYTYPEEEDMQTIDQSSHHSGHSSNSVEPEKNKLIFQSTCHSAMDSCNNNYHCRMLLAPILHHCDISHCNRNSCMEALQTFYGKPNFHWNVEIAFCLCKKTENKHDACLIAQERLHPVCAQQIEESPQPTCLHLAEVCKENKACRTRLEYYEQSCAVDSATKKCAGSPTECRKSILAILGTDLRTTCACKGSDISQLYECLGWQRLLWVNPCVVEAQKHFHMKKAAEQSRLSTHTPTRTTSTTTTTTTTSTISTVQLTAVKSITEASLKVQSITEFLPPPQAFVPTSTATSGPVTTTTEKKTTTRRTRPTTTTTTAPPRSCIVQRPQVPDQFIREGSFKRIYHEDEFECSDICECEIGEKLSCRTICIDRMPCKTEFAFYNHAAPAYQAFRGRCLCYSGRFICMKPSPTDYFLPHGVFLFLGYSEVDERELNKNHTTHLVVVQDIVRVLQNLIREEAEKVNGTFCNLEFFNATRENVIIAGKLSDEIDTSKMSPMEILEKEKEECAEFLELISDRLNSRHPEFLSHVLLSIFKMAEVEIVPIETSSATRPHISSIAVILLSSIIQILQSQLTIS